MTEQQVRNELKLLRKTEHIIKCLMETETNYRNKIRVLELKEPTKAVKDSILAINELLKKLNIEYYIINACEIESKYAEVINNLLPVEKLIIYEGYINNKPYWKIGKQIGYSEISIKKRIPLIIEKIAREIE